MDKGEQVISVPGAGLFGTRRRTFVGARACGVRRRGVALGVGPQCWTPGVRVGTRQTRGGHRGRRRARWCLATVALQKGRRCGRRSLQPSGLVADDTPVAARPWQLVRGLAWPESGSVQGGLTPVVSHPQPRSRGRVRAVPEPCWTTEFAPRQPSRTAEIACARPRAPRRSCTAHGACRMRTAWRCAADHTRPRTSPWPRGRPRKRTLQRDLADIRVRAAPWRRVQGRETRAHASTGPSAGRCRVACLRLRLRLRGRARICECGRHTRGFHCATGAQRVAAGDRPSVGHAAAAHAPAVATTTFPSSTHPSGPVSA